MLDHDIHIHTFLSACCSDPRCVPEYVIPRAADAGLKIIGFSDHLWDSAMPCDSDWHRPQDFRHISQLRRMIPQDTRGLRVLFGCETEYLGDGRVAVSREVAEQLDFVLVPISHAGFVAPATGAGPERLARAMLQWFGEAIELELATGIAHPFLPCRYQDHADEIIGLISDSAFVDVFGRAAERGVSLGVVSAFFPGARGGETAGFHDETFVRMFALARQAGCVFHFGSDAHALEAVDRVPKLAPYVRQIGITAEHILPLVRSE